MKCKFRDAPALAYTLNKPLLDVTLVHFQSIPTSVAAADM